MNNYAETKKTLDKIRSEYSCSGELLFRQAIKYVIDYGADNLRDDWNYEHIKQDINEYHDNAEAESKNLIIAREFELAILECARAIAQVDIYDLLVYIQKEVWLSNEGGIDYERAVKLLKNCLAWFADDCCGCAETLEKFELLDLDDDEIEALGYGYMFDVREEK